MTIETLLSWHYLVFWLPMMASALLMLLSSLRLGHHHGLRHGAHGHTAHLGHAGHTGHAAHPGSAGGHVRMAMRAGAGRISHGGARPASGRAVARNSGAAHQSAMPNQSQAAADQHALTAVHAPASAHSHTPAAMMLGLVGAERAPLPIVLGSFFLAWGFFGFWANLAIIHTPSPPFYEVLPSLGIALVGGVLGARGAAELAARVLPPDESMVLSHAHLFGLSGEVTYRVTETSGRIFIYDEYGTLHDESCRVSPGEPAIEKGRSAIVLDMDEKGYLIVKEIA